MRPLVLLSLLACSGSDPAGESCKGCPEGECPRDGVCTRVCNRSAECGACEECSAGFCLATSGCDAVAPTVLGTSPTDGDIGVSAAVVIGITFDEAMDTTATAEAVTLSPAASGNASWSSGDSILSFTPSALLQGAVTVTVSTGAADVAGNHLSTSVSFGFTVTDAGIFDVSHFDQAAWQ